jgi:hypothetical protein
VDKTERGGKGMMEVDVKKVIRKERRRECRERRGEQREGRMDI